jgi:putative flippase GtrA
VQRFAVVGVANTLVSFAVFRAVLGLLPRVRAAPAVAQICDYAVALVCSFVLNRGWTFRSGGARRPEFARFLASQLLMLTLSSAALQVAIGGLHLPATASWVATTGAVAVVNYLLLQRWVFRALPG